MEKSKSIDFERAEKVNKILKFNIFSFYKGYNENGEEVNEVGEPKALYERSKTVEEQYRILQNRYVECLQEKDELKTKLIKMLEENKN
jgi:hypothetical protein